MILAHLCDEPKGLKTNMCLVNHLSPISPTLLVLESVTSCYYFFKFKMQSLVYLPFALANALTARLNAGYVLLFLFYILLQKLTWVSFGLYKTDKLVSFRVPLVDELWVLLGYCVFTGLLLKQIKPYFALALFSSLTFLYLVQNSVVILALCDICHP